MVLGTNDAAINNSKEAELLNALESEKVLFASIEEITTPQIHILDMNTNNSQNFRLADLIENKLSLDQTLEFEKADLMFEYQGDLFYLRG